MSEPIVRAMTLEDVPAVYAIECASFPSPWSEESFIQEMTENTMAKYFVVTLDEEIAAFGGMWMVFDELHVTNIAVAPLFRGRGLGHVIVEGMEQFAKQNGFAHMTLEVRVSNDRAIALYEKHGFKSVGIRPKYYIDSGEDALVMWKEF